MPAKSKEFKIAAISSNQNSFGLNQFVFIARDGEVWTACRNRQYTLRQRGDIVLLQEPYGDALAELSFELPQRRAETCPKAILQEVWGSTGRQPATPELQNIPIRAPNAQPIRRKIFRDTAAVPPADYAAMERQVATHTATKER